MNIVEQLFTPFVSKTKKIRLGNNSDGGYIVLKEPISSVKKLISFGVGDNIEFELQIENNYNITTDMFDGEPDYRVFPDLKDIPTGAVVKISNKKMNYHKYHVTKHNINSILPEDDFILKMDVEGAEWEILREINDTTMEKMKMLAIEFHFGNYDCYTKNNPYDIIDVLTKLKNTHTLIHVHGNTNGGFVENMKLPAVLECCYVLNEYATNEIDMSEYPILDLDYPNLPFHTELSHTWWK